MDASVELAEINLFGIVGAKHVHYNRHMTARNGPSADA